jgi:uncharacterized protein (TIGR04255 family)
MTFSPILPNHAIERCTATVAFAPDLPDKAFLRVADEATQILTTSGFVAQPTMTLGFEVRPDGSMASKTMVAAPRIFQSAAGTLALTISAQGIVLTTISYVRWQPFIGEFERLAIPIVRLFRQVVSVSAVRLEYWDRFIWSPDWSDFNIRQLIQENSMYVAPAIPTKPREWHSHTGWFEPTRGGLRRLVNINIDVSEFVRPSFQSQPSVGIYSSLTDQANIPGYAAMSEDGLTEAFVIDRLEDQHLALKEILGHIIVDEMATRISLFPRRSA